MGVIADQGGKQLAIKAKRAVVMTCGGYENNPQMMRDFNAVTEVAPYGTPYNTGDGIKMSMKVGADLWHLSAQSGMRAAFRVPGTNNGIYFEPQTTKVNNNPVAGYIYVNGDGLRYYNEDTKQRHGYMYLDGVYRPTPVPVPAFLIMDDTMRAAGSVFSPGMNHNLGWQGIIKKLSVSADNSAEVEKGWIVKADTLDELAAKIGVKPQNLLKTVEKWNDACKKGIDAEFGRSAANLGPIQKAPFYAIRISLAILNTQGGPRHNPKAQIVDPDGKPIPRLYSAGELGSIYTFLYNGGGNIGECLAFGRIAGRNAAAEKPWK